MNKLSVLLFTIVATLSVRGALAQDHADDERAIRQNIERYLEAYQRRDAQSLAEFWGPNAEYVSPTSGQRVIGRAAIQAEFEAVFAEPGDAELQVSLSSIRFLTPDVALEEGVARVTRPGEAARRASYTAVHVKRDGKWLLESVRETQLPSEPSNYEYLKALEWMIGEWVDRDGDAEITTRCQWTKNKCFLTRSFAVKIQDRIEMEGTQVVGWDAAEGRIRSLVFDTDGGFNEGTWTLKGDRWIISAKATLPDGRTGSMVNIITRIDDDSFSWQSVGREVGGELLPNIDPVVVVRKQEEAPDQESPLQESPPSEAVEPEPGGDSE
jgi:uncharacterized protein (TIGR02246 family)